MQSFRNLHLSLTSTHVYGEEKERRNRRREKKEKKKRKWEGGSSSPNTTISVIRGIVCKRERDCGRERKRERGGFSFSHLSSRWKNFRREREGKRVREKEEKEEEGSSSATKKFLSREGSRACVCERE